MTPEPKDSENEPKVQQATGSLVDTTQNTIHSTPSRGDGRATSSSVSQSHAQTESLKRYNAGDMAGPISVDLEGAQQCKATEMIKFLLAFCRSGDDKTVSVHDEQVIDRVSTKVIPESKKEVFGQSVRLVATLYPILDQPAKSPGV